ncbi:MAG: phoP 1 [Ramlibacter sp.]|jgi:CheY-like chemotaxis protein|nr:phoP 1 [Ramlibacter sp.]
MAALAPSSTAVRRALVVEDDGAIAFLLRFLLERHGWQVSVAEDGLQAMQAIEQGEPPQLVLLDAMLPVHDGLTLLARLRSLPQWKDVPVVMLTAKGDEGFVARAMAAGATDFVAKPFDAIQLAERLEKLVPA